MNYGKSLGLETLQDEIGNVLIRKPASAGMEGHPGVILQGHMDMVPQKNSDKVFDFEKDAIQTYIEDNGEWVTANGTTLGADNGIGVATAMAILADKNAVHPPLEAFFTVDEETGMYGANDLKGYRHQRHLPLPGGRDGERRHRAEGHAERLQGRSLGMRHPSAAGECYQAPLPLPEGRRSELRSPSGLCRGWFAEERYPS